MKFTKYFLHFKGSIFFIPLKKNFAHDIILLHEILLILSPKNQKI